MLIYFDERLNNMYIMILKQEIIIFDMKYVYSILSINLPTDIKQIIFEKWIKEIAQRRTNLPNIHIEHCFYLETPENDYIDDEYWYSE